MTQKEMLTKILRRHESLCESCIKNNLECDEIACGFGRQIIDTADYLLANGVVVPVLCNECTHGEDDGTGIQCHKHNKQFGDYDFCSYGERSNK